MYAITEQHLPDWKAPELGLPRATLLAALIIVSLIIGLCVWLARPAPLPSSQPIEVTQATLTTLPQPTPPPPPKVVPPPKPIPAVIPKPLPVPSKIAVATKPPPPVHHIFKPAPKPTINHAPPPTPTPQPSAPAAPSAPPTSGIGPYGNQMYQIIQANQDVPAALAQLGVSGTAVIEIVVAPNGHILSAKVYKSSGVPLIDQTALQHAQSASLPPFNDDMPQAPHTFLIPIEIQPNPDQ